jgi:chemotaxis signal transduction protein
MSLVDDLLPHMRRVLAAERDLHDLTMLWQLIEASSAISCPGESASILPTLSETRVRFKELQDRLVHQLASENLAELGDELSSVGQCAIDILVRNLFERTADVGFLATDDPLRAFCVMGEADRSAHRAALLRRLGEYRAKYTVYDDLIVLDPQGRVLARLDDAGPTSSTDPILAEALSRDGYAERYAPTDLASKGRAALHYAHRIVDDGQRNVGVLVLRFRIEDELERIFSSVVAGREGVALSLIDERGRVVVSNDAGHVPPGATVRTGPPGQVAVTIFAGREYLSVTCEARGYQGYDGPGWRAHAMVSLLTAFRGGHEAEPVDHTRVNLDNEELLAIQEEVVAINRNLQRVVWNGRLKAGADSQAGGEHDRLKAVLQQVNQSGLRTRDRVAAAIGDLYRTSLGRSRHQAGELARLAADIMDRNLYERANDCRWWALSPVIRRALSGADPARGTDALNTVLSQINDLYTVYTRLVVFDRGGIVRGVSRDEPEATLLGRPVDPAWVAAVAALGDTQRYAVSEFAATPLYGGEPTYVYLAAIRDEGGSFSGGIAIVFHAGREFKAMLDDVLGGRDGWAAFVDGAGKIVASTDAELPIGATLPTGREAGIVEYRGANYVQAVQRAPGYREFKCEDGYANGVTAVVALRLGAVDRRRTDAADMVMTPLATTQPSQRHEFALFQVASGRYALPAAHVLEACEPRGLMRMSSAPSQVAGMMELPTPSGRRVLPVLCARRLLGVETPPRAGDGVVVVVSSPESAAPAFGLRVDQVLAVFEIGPEHRQPVSASLRAGLPALSALLRLGGAQGDLLAQVLDPDALRRACGLAVPEATDLSL